MSESLIINRLSGLLLRRNPTIAVNPVQQIRFYPLYPHHPLIYQVTKRKKPDNQLIVRLFYSVAGTGLEPVTFGLCALLQFSLPQKVSEFGVRTFSSPCFADAKFRCLPSSLYTFNDKKIIKA